MEEMRIRVVVVSVCLLILALGRVTLPLSAQSSQERKTVWQGVYTDEQATRGKALYEMNCAGCHGQDLAGDRGSSLQGRDFMERWREDNAETLFLFMKGSMPPNRNRNVRRVPLPDETYIDIISYVFQSNKFPSGSGELKLDTLPGTQIEGQFGPQPVPHGSRVQVVGCMTKTPTGWSVTRATEPVRTRLAEMVTSDEVKAAEGTTAGKFTFQLANFGYIGSDFVPDDHADQKMLVKGMLVRQPNAERINLTSITMVAANCSK
jgi:S-disulfanyl-L-cysteine oxidoreductase SoxD